MGITFTVKQNQADITQPTLFLNEKGQWISCSTKEDFKSHKLTHSLQELGKMGIFGTEVQKLRVSIDIDIDTHDTLGSVHDFNVIADAIHALEAGRP